MKLFPLLLVFAGFTTQLQAQHISKADIVLLAKKEDSLKVPALRILNGTNPAAKLSSDSIFTRGLVRALKVKHSFDYPFDSLITISKIYPPDSSFRIFTWQMAISDNVIRQHGAIQMRTPDGSLKLYPLIDKSDVTENMSDTIGNNYGWMGAVYYKIIPTTWQNKNYYTLLGFDENNIRSDKKIIEILTFNQDGPIFGSRSFVFENGNVFQKNMARYVMEFKKDVGPRLTYDPELQMIVMEHLVSESNQPLKKWTLIPDGDYEGFKWINGKWAYVSKIFNDITPEGKPPTPKTIRDEKGNVEYEKLKGNEGTTTPTP
ncbi:hypothetical protein [Ferruginibacter sp. HRS2-29]|uniref:hypothetical protein n=1 Tax=Ferruginibacter sp. HRS2-29 TaxID=2487334 RepID=UPI0020CCED5B|nr:hypothetical protein [Ferruginibacter sp. HRS2-29]MCP9750356.1 hypothetical protein [Ferruginibacter sp. HRS2-29]